MPCVGGQPTGPCKNAKWATPWRAVTLKSSNDEDAEMVDDLRDDFRHERADFLEVDEIIAMRAHLDDEDHEFWLAQIVRKKVKCNEPAGLADAYGNIILQDCWYVTVHFLEWRDMEDFVYSADTTRVAFIQTHLVCCTDVQLERFRGGWKLQDGEAERVLLATER